MNNIGIVTLLSVIVSAAAPSAPEYSPAKTFATAKSTDQFASCFANVQDSGGLPWWFVPKDNGGTFSNLGSRTTASAYFVVVSDRGSSREVRVEGRGAYEGAVKRAINQCV